MKVEVAISDIENNEIKVALVKHGECGKCFSEYKNECPFDQSKCPRVTSVLNSEGEWIARPGNARLDTCGAPTFIIDKKSKYLIEQIKGIEL